MNDTHDLLGAYCTDALDPAERAAFEAHLATCGTCRTEAAQFREVLAAMAEIDPVQPPAGLEEALVSQVRAAGEVAASAPSPALPHERQGSQDQADSAPTLEPATDISAHAPRAGRQGWARVAPWMAAAAAGAILFATGVGVGRSQVPAESATATSGQIADVVAVASAADATVMSVDIMGTTSRLVTSEEMDKSIFLASELPMPAKGMCYQVWRVTEDGEMVSAGAFTPDSDGHIAAVLDGGTSDVTKFMITMEPPGGSDHPTGEMLGEIEA